MTNPNRRAVLGWLAFAATGLAGSQTFAATKDGHAAGYDVAPAADHLAVIPRRTGDPMKFTASLDGGPIKATTGGWARDVTTRTLPIATAIAGAHLYLNAGGVREMHWHDSAEWACIFPRNCGHTIQNIGTEDCELVGVLDSGRYEEATLSDWMKRAPRHLLANNLGLSEEAFTPGRKGKAALIA